MFVGRVGGDDQQRGTHQTAQVVEHFLPTPVRQMALGDHHMDRMPSQEPGGPPPVRHLEELPAALAEDLPNQRTLVLISAYEQSGNGTLRDRLVHGVCPLWIAHHTRGSLETGRMTYSPVQKTVHSQSSSPTPVGFSEKFHRPKDPRVSTSTSPAPQPDTGAG